MTPAELRRVRELFDVVAELPHEQRGAWLQEHDIAPAVRRQVELQLRMLDSKPGELVSPITVSAAHEDPQTIGPFRVLRRIGEGGMGVVYEAEQTAPIRRTVAVKLIKPGMDSRAILTRFEAERRTLALMEHPGIARVLDAGADDRGRPWFAMELFDGVPITDYCDRERLDIGARLRVFVDVCRALQHAHQRGVLHRDLKPGNVLVVEVDGRPVPKIIDFGVAKAIHEIPAEGLQTEVGVRIGTPGYMAPEQAADGSALPDTRSDQYSLGVVLFELLTGALPFASAKTPVRRAALEQVPRPSTVVRLRDEGAIETARLRRLEPRGLEQQLQGDLDWITSRALAADSEQRYGSVGELAEDIERHLAHEPVLAGPPSFVYRARCFVRRHLLAMVAVTAVVLALVSGGAVAVWSAVAAGRSLEAAQRTQAELYDTLSRSFARARAQGEVSPEQPRFIRLNLDIIEASVPGFRARYQEVASGTSGTLQSYVQKMTAHADLVAEVRGRLRPEAVAAAADQLASFGADVLHLGDAVVAARILTQAEALWSSLLPAGDLRLVATRALLLDSHCMDVGSSGMARERAAKWLDEIVAGGYADHTPEHAVYRSRLGAALAMAEDRVGGRRALEASLPILGSHYPTSWLSLTPRMALVRLLDSVAPDAAHESDGDAAAAARAALAEAMVDSAVWGHAHLDAALGQDRRELLVILDRLERLAESREPAEQVELALTEFLDRRAQLGLADRAPLSALLATWLGGSALTCVNAYGWSHPVPGRVSQEAERVLRMHRDRSLAAFTKAAWILSACERHRGEIDVAEARIRDALRVEPGMPRADALLPLRLDPQYHWRLRIELGACLAARGRFAEGHAHLLEAWLGLSEWMGAESGLADFALRALSGAMVRWHEVDEVGAAAASRDAGIRLSGRQLERWRAAVNAASSK